MRLKKLIKAIALQDSLLGIEDFEVRGISCNSKDVRDNYLFVAIKGLREDGNKFIEEAIERGAKAIVIETSETPPKKVERILFIKVENARQALAKLAAEFFRNPAAEIKVVGITGTNGKTTVSYLLEALLKEADFYPGIIGTVNYRFQDKVIPSKNTTPGPIELQSMLADMLKAKINYAILEVSSHALNQNRTEGIDFHSALFTNLTQDHLDYHNNMENYFQAKCKLFRRMNSGSFAVINNDNAYGRRIRELTKAEVITYGIDNKSDIMAEDLKFDMAHTEFLIKSPWGDINLKTKLIGQHNVYNVLATVAWALKEGIDTLLIKSGLEKFQSVPGRLERIYFPGDFAVFIDYAHTEDALRHVLLALKPLCSNKIIVVFGCGGERDTLKRPKMGEVVSELADFAIITNDNPRSEDPEEIIEDIKRGIRKNNYLVIPDRREAIKKSLSLASTGDIVLIAGKGHEHYQILANRIIDFDDRDVVRECLKSLS